MIDSKYSIHAKGVENRTLFTQDNAMLFLARDAALIPTLMFYQEECARLGSGQAHIDSIDALIVRVREFQQVGIENHSYRVPGLDPVTDEVPNYGSAAGVEEDMGNPALTQADTPSEEGSDEAAPAEVSDQVPQQEGSEVGTTEEVPEGGGGDTPSENTGSTDEEPEPEVT